MVGAEPSRYILLRHPYLLLLLHKSKNKKKILFFDDQYFPNPSTVLESQRTNLLIHIKTFDEISRFEKKWKKPFLWYLTFFIVSMTNKKIFFVII